MAEESAALQAAVNRIALLCQHLVAIGENQIAALLERNHSTSANGNNEWRTELNRIAADWPAAAREDILLVREVLERFNFEKASAACWSELTIFARGVLAQHHVVVELVREPTQPIEWYEMPIEQDVPQPVVERVGLAVRRPPGNWLLFPRGRLIIPISTIVYPAATIDAMPEGYRDLLESVTDPANDFEDELLRRLNEWPAAAADNSLDIVAVQFYVDFWHGIHERWRRDALDHAAIFVSRLEYFLQHALGLFPFCPVTYQDFPDGWLQRIPGPPMVTGRVRRVVRPGLQDDQNQLRLPALVEVE
jgi:hypothetical protein